MHWFNALALNDTYTYDITKHRQHIFHASIFKEQNFLSFRQIRSKDKRSNISEVSKKVQESLGNIWHYIEGSARRSSIQVARELSKHLDATRGFEFPTSSIRIPAVAFWVARRMQVFFQSDSTRIWFPLIYGQCLLCLLSPSSRFRCWHPDIVGSQVQVRFTGRQISNETSTAIATEGRLCTEEYHI